MLKTLFQEEVCGNVNLNYLKEKGAVICRKCKCNITSYIHAKALIIERLHQAATVIQSQSVYAVAEMCGKNVAAGHKRGGFGDSDSCNPKRFYSNPGDSPAVVVSLLKSMQL